VRAMFGEVFGERVTGWVSAMRQHRPGRGARRSISNLRNFLPLGTLFNRRSTPNCRADRRVIMSILYAYRCPKLLITLARRSPQCGEGGLSLSPESGWTHLATAKSTERRDSGGCFWGSRRYFTVKGVISATSDTRR